MSDKPPTVGTIVHYTAPGSGDGVYPQTCRAAIVAEVADSMPPSLGVVDLMVINPTGIHFRENVARDPGHPSGHTSYTWHWSEQIRTELLSANTLPHSRACGITQHEHGILCSDDCPTCHGRLVNAGLL